MAKNYSYVITDYGPMRTFDPRQFRSKLKGLQSEVDFLVSLMGENLTDNIDYITEMLTWFKDLPESTSAKALYEHVDSIDQHAWELEEALNTEIEARKAVDGQTGQTYLANDATNYISKATDLNNADVTLDSALKTESDRAILQEDTIESAIGLATDGTHISTTGNYTNGATTITGEIAAIDSALKIESDRAINQEDTIENAIGLAKDGTHITTSGNYTSKATTVTGEISALDTQVKLNADAIDVLNGEDEGSVKKALKDAKDYTDTKIQKLDVDEIGGTGKVVTTISETDGKISATAIDLVSTTVARTATEATDTKVAVDGTNVEKAIESLATSIKTVKDNAAKYSVKKITDNLANNIREAYQLVETVEGISKDIDVQIPIYKDSSLKSVALSDTNESGTSGQFLVLTYILDTGEESVQYLDVSKFLVESEFKEGLQVNSKGEVSVLIDPDSEFISVSDKGIKVSGIKQELSNKLEADSIGDNTEYSDLFTD